MKLANHLVPLKFCVVLYEFSFHFTESLKKTSETKEEACQKMTAEIKQLKQKLLVQEKVTNNSESTSKKYLSALMESKEHLNAMLASVTDALGDKGEEEEVEVKKETDIKTNGAS